MKRELATSQLSFIQTKDDIYNFANTIISEVKSGMINPLDVLVQFKKIEKSFEVIKPELQQLFIEEGEKYNKQVYKGGLIEVKNSPAKWNYNSDPILTEMEAESNLLNDKIKARKKMLQSLQEPVFSSSEGIELTPAFKEEQGQTISVTFK
jgi:hypothetical protein